MRNRVSLRYNWLNIYKWEPSLFLPSSHSLLSSPLPNSAPNQPKSPASMTSELPTPSARRLLKLEDLIPLPTSHAWNTSTKCNPNAGPAFAGSERSLMSPSRAADHHPISHAHSYYHICFSLHKPPTVPSELIAFLSGACALQKRQIWVGE